LGTLSNLELEFEMLVFEERGKLEYPEKNLSGARALTTALSLLLNVRVLLKIKTLRRLGVSAQ